MAFGGLGGCLPLRHGKGDDTGISAECHARLCADLLAAQRTSTVARISLYVDGASTDMPVTLTGYSGRNGSGGGHAPSVVASYANGSVSILLDTHTNALGQVVDLMPYLSGGATVIARYRGVDGVWRNASAATLQGKVLMYLQALELTHFEVLIFGADTETTIGDYGGHVLNHDAKAENGTTYAYQWYEYLKTAQGSAYSTSDSSVRSWGLKAEARALGTSQRHSEMLAASATPGGADVKLQLWMTVLGVQQALRSQSSVRAECERKARPPEAPATGYLSTAIADLLGLQASFVRLYHPTGTMTDWPSGTYWPGINNGPGTLDMGGGVWASPRSRVTVQVDSGFSLSTAELTDLMQRRLAGFLDQVLPATADWAWETGGGSGLILGTSKLGLTAFADSAPVRNMYVACDDGNTICRIRAADGALTRYLDAGATSTSLVADDKGFLYVVNAGAYTISKIDAATLTVSAVWNIGFPAATIAWDGRQHLCVINASDTLLSWLNTDTGVVDATTTVATQMRFAAWDGDEHLYVCHLGVGSGTTVERVSAVTRQIDATITVGTGPLRAARDGFGAMYVVNGSSNNVSKINMATGAVVATIPVGSTPRGIAWDGAAHMYVANYGGATISRIAVATNTVDATISVGLYPESVSGDGAGHIYVACYGSASVYRIEVSSGNVDLIVPVADRPNSIVYLAS
jgi:YVTN family beta-propeller protein